MGLCFASLAAAAHDEPHSTLNKTSGSDESKNVASLSDRTSSLGNSLFSEISSGRGNGSTSTIVTHSGQILETANLKVFTFADLKAATRGFKSDALLGEGGFGKVYKSWSDQRTLSLTKASSGMVVTIKKLNPESVQGFQEWKVASLIQSITNEFYSMWWLEEDKSALCIRVPLKGPAFLQTKFLSFSHPLHGMAQDGLAAKKKRAPSGHIPKLALSDLVKYFDMPIVEASRNLNVGLTVLKRKCREFGIPRWPQRKIKSLDSLIHDLQEEAKNQETKDKAAAMAVVKRQRMLESEKENIEKKPFMDIQNETKRFRQDVFKRRHRARAIEKQSSTLPNILAPSKESKGN